jgi:hypothetical protein
MKKLIIVSVTAAVAMFGAVGVAYAGDDDQGGSDHSRSHHSSGHQGSGGTNCTSDNTIDQSNRGHQFIGGNLGAQDAETNVLGGQLTRPAAICPSIGNNNHL